MRRLKSDGHITDTAEVMRHGEPATTSVPDLRSAPPPRRCTGSLWCAVEEVVRICPLESYSPG